MTRRTSTARDRALASLLGEAGEAQNASQTPKTGHRGVFLPDVVCESFRTDLAAHKPAGAFVVVLPYPPSVNHLWRRVGQKTLLSAEGRRYHETAGLCLNLALAVPSNVVPPTPHAVTLLATPPDRRRRDLDNLPKALLDLVYRGIGQDDSAIERLLIAWRRDGRGPCVEVVIEALAPAATGAGEGA